MRIFISCGPEDGEVVDRIQRRLSDDGHDVSTSNSYDFIVPGDNIAEKMERQLSDADAAIVVVSRSSFRSRRVKLEFSNIGLRELSNSSLAVIPVRIDNSEVPSYIASRAFVDLSQDFEAGLNQLSNLLKAATPATLGQPPQRSGDEVPPRTIQTAKLHEALRNGRLTLVCGAGISVDAGVPTWNSLLLVLLERMMEEQAKKQPSFNKLGKDAAEAFQNKYDSLPLILGKFLKNSLGDGFRDEVRRALYAKMSTTSPAIAAIMELARPQRDVEALDSIVTFNFDCLVEEQLEVHNIRHKAIFSEAIVHDTSQLPVYHVHGYLPRTGDIPANPEDLVFSEDAYHSRFIDPFSWSNLILLNKLTQNTCLFVGLSLTDPNMRRLLDVAWRKNPNKTMSHYLVKPLPTFPKGDALNNVAKLLEEQDANELGLNVIWISNVAELPVVLREISG